MFLMQQDLMGGFLACNQGKTLARKVNWPSLRGNVYQKGLTLIFLYYLLEYHEKL